MIYYPEDFKEEVREMYADGLKPINIAWYLGVSKFRVHQILFPEKHKEYNRRYRQRLTKEKLEAIKKKVQTYNKIYRNTRQVELIKEKVFWEKGIQL